MKKFILKNTLHSAFRDYTYDEFYMLDGTTMRQAEHSVEDKDLISEEVFWDLNGDSVILEYELSNEFFKDFYDTEILDMLENHKDKFDKYAALIATNQFLRESEPDRDAIGWQARQYEED